MILEFNEYYDKVRACFLGKNVGGTLGGPFEFVHGVSNVEFYTHDLSKGVLPNDDLDLQLVWLLAAEKYGPAVNSSILAEYWAYKIVAHWAEYGIGKVNMRAGLVPPLSGYCNNYFKDSNGAWIRSEIWACLCPGRPDLAVKYAYEDASVDHADEGIYAEIFTAALESAAFAEKNMETLIDIALSYIPEDCAVTKAVRLVQSLYREGKTWREARKILLTEIPGSFHYKVLDNIAPEDVVPRGKYGFDAPGNIGLMILGWYYGEGDFGKALCTAVNCGEDADCTAATLGALWGIIYGTEGIPQKWLDPIGDEIKTVSLDRTHELYKICNTVTELTDRITNLMPAFMVGSINLNGTHGAEIITKDCKSLYDIGYQYCGFTRRYFKDELELKNPATITVKGGFYNAYLKFVTGVKIREGEEIELELSFKSKFRPGWIETKIYAPDDWEILPTREPCLSADYKLNNYKPYKIKIIPHNLTKGKYEFPIQLILSDVRVPKYIPVTFIVE